MNPTPGDLIRYLETLTVTQGRLAGSALQVLPWQGRFIRRTWGPGVESASCSVGRGSGKTALLSAIACAHVDGPMAVQRGEVVIVASSFEQARIAFEHCIAYLGDALRDRQRWRVWDTAQQARIEDRRTGARIRCLGSDPRRAHGLAPVLILADEGAQWPTNTGERMVSALRTAAGKQPFCRFVAIGTRPSDPEHWFTKMLAGGADVSLCYAADPKDPPFQKRTWAKANPSLPYMPDLEAAIRKEAVAAKADPGILASFKALRLNLGTHDTEQAFLLDAATWARIEGDAPREGRPVWGADLSTSDAMSSVAAWWPSGRVECIAAFPGEPSLAERGLKDGVGNLYTKLEARGELIRAGGAAVDLTVLFREALARFGPPAAIALDRWREAEARDALKAAGVPVCRLEPRGMGFRDGSQDVELFRRAVAAGKVTPAPSLLLASAMSECRLLMDPAGNVKIGKSTEGGRRRRAKDDAAVATVLAVALGSRRRPQASGTGAYLGVA